MVRAEGFDIANSDGEEACGGVETAAIGGVGRALELFFEVDKGAGNLDEALVECVFRAGFTQPEVFKHVVRFVIATGVEALKKTAVALVIITFAEAEIAEHGFDTVRFFHSVLKMLTHSVKITGDNIRCLSDKFPRGGPGSMSSLPPSRDGGVFFDVAGTAWR